VRICAFAPPHKFNATVKLNATVKFNGTAQQNRFLRRRREQLDDRIKPRFPGQLGCRVNFSSDRRFAAAASGRLGTFRLPNQGFALAANSLCCYCSDSGRRAGRRRLPEQLCMRALATIMLALAAISLCGLTAPAAFAGAYAERNPACSADSFYVCSYEPYGHRFCGCRSGGNRPACPSGYRFACLPAPNSEPYCACY
jgi:hypothetical protein